jgi:peptidoglycan/xylan/chitin deacetylase (PgdA/CDA1 family)
MRLIERRQESPGRRWWPWFLPYSGRWLEYGCETCSGGRLRQPESIAKRLFQAFGGLGAVRWRNRDGFRILMYHRFPAERRQEFARQLEHVKRNYRVLPLEQIVRALKEGRAIEPNTLAITVDDGHRDFYETAYPELKARALTATVFLTTGFLDGSWLWFDRVNWLFRNARVDAAAIAMPYETRHFALDTDARRMAAGGEVAESLVLLENADREKRIGEMERSLKVATPAVIAAEFAPLLWNQVREMAANGISFGAHTVTHPTLSAVSEGAQIEAELQESKRRVEEETQREAPIFCYPNGKDSDISDAVVASARASGFAAAVQTEPGLNTRTTDLLRLRRMAADPGHNEHYFARICAVMRR